MIFIRRGKEYLKVPNKNWNNYLNIVSPHRKTDKSIKNRCALKEKELLWCDTCNTGIGSWKNSCVNVITSLNYVKYENILKLDDNDDVNFFYEIELDRNDDKSTI
jgi:hypothetical protein